MLDVFEICLTDEFKDINDKKSNVLLSSQIPIKSTTKTYQTDQEQLQPWYKYITSYKYLILFPSSSLGESKLLTMMLPFSKHMANAKHITSCASLVEYFIPIENGSCDNNLLKERVVTTQRR